MAKTYCSFSPGPLARGVSLLSGSQSRSVTMVSGPTPPWTGGTLRPRESKSLVQDHPPSCGRAKARNLLFWLLAQSQWEGLLCLLPPPFITSSMSFYFRIKPIIWPSLPDHKKTLEQLCKKPKKVSASGASITMSEASRQPRMMLQDEEWLNLKCRSFVYHITRVPHKMPAAGSWRWETKMKYKSQNFPDFPRDTSDPEVSQHLQRQRVN